MPALAAVTPPPQPLPPLRRLRTLVRNPIEVWPAAVYRESVFRSELLGRETVFVMDPDLVRQVLVERADSFSKAETLRRSLGPALGDAILTADGARWRWQRRAAAPIFRQERLLGFVPAMRDAAARTRDRWLNSPASEIDVAREMMHTTFDIIVETMLSGRGRIDVDKVERGITRYLETTGWPIALALLRAPRWLPYPGRRRAGTEGLHLREMVTALVAERRRSGERRNDLITLLLEATDAETGQSMDDRTLADNLLTFISAGHETTALALTWTFYLLSLHPEIEARLLAEIAAAGGADIDALPYTRQVLSEALRLYPPAPVVVRAAKEAMTLGDVPIAVGTPVYVPIYAIHRHRSLWTAPDAFDPDRFEAEAAKAPHRYAYLPFGAGPRICIGMSFALMEAVVILATLLPAIRLKLRPGYVPELKMRITLRPAQGMPMTPERR